MKCQVKVTGVAPQGDDLILATEGGSSLRISNTGSAKTNPPKAGDVVEVTLSSENSEKLGEQGAEFKGRFHRIVPAPAESGAQAGSNDFGR